MKNVKNTQGGGASNLNTPVTKTINSKTLFKPLIASSLALALGVSVGMAQGSGSPGSSQPYYDITTNTSDSGLLQALRASQVTGNGTTQGPWIWNYSGFLAKNGQTGHLNVENAIFKLGTNGNGFIGGEGNSSDVSLSFTNSTLVGSINSGQNGTSAVQTVSVSANTTIQAAYVFSGNNTYENKQWAMIGNVYTDVTSGGNFQVAFAEGANMKGNIYSASGQTVNVNFSNKTAPSTGNIFEGRIGTPGDINKSERQGTINVTFVNNATLRSSEDGTGTLLYVAANAYPETKINLTLGSSSNNANTSSTLSGDIIAGTPLFYKGYNQHEEIVITSYADSLIVGQSGVDNQILARKTGVNTFDIKAGSATFNSIITAGAQGATAVDDRGRNIFKFSSSSTGAFLGDITTQYSGNRNYILALGSGAIKIGDTTKAINITSESDNGGSNGGIFITDYDSTTSGFNEAQNTTNGNITLNAKTLSVLNSKDNIGQSFILDSYNGSAIINSGDSRIASINIGGNETTIIRFRDTSSNTSITLGGENSGNSLHNAYFGSSDVNGRAILQAKDIKIYGKISSGGGSTEIIAGNTASTLKTDGITVDKSGKTYIMQANTGGILSITGTDGSSPISLEILGTGGTNDARLYITDYDSRVKVVDGKETGGFNESESNANGILSNLKVSTLRFNNGSTGQKSYIDFDQGSVTIDSATADSQSIILGNSNNTNVIRFRDTVAATAITIGGADSNGDSFGNGNIVNQGSAAKTFFQAKTVIIYGNVLNNGATDFASVTSAGDASLHIYGDLHTTGGTTTLNYTSGNTANTITIDGILRTDFGTLTIADNTTAVNTLSAKAIYSLGNYQINGTSDIKAKSVTIGFVGNVKDDKFGGLDAAPSNTIIAEKILINADLKGGANISGSTLIQQDGKVLLGSASTTKAVGDSSGNVAIFNNMAKGSNTIISIKTNGANESRILGDIYTFGGANNIKLSGSADIAQLKNVNFVGNIYTNGGSNNLIFDKTYWAPNAVYIDASSENIESTLASGSILTNGGVSNIVFRQGSVDLLQGKVGAFDVTTTSGETNIVMQADLTQAGSLNAKAIINYTGGTTNFIFAKANDMGVDVQDSFDADATNASANKILGVTYSNGVKLTLRNDSVQIGNETVNLVNKYGEHFKDKNGNLFVLTSEREQTVDTITFDGLAIGEITSLNNSIAKTYNNTLAESSAFVGNITLASNANATLTMSAKTKLILTSDKATISALGLQGQTSFNQEQLVLETLAQTENRIINLATNGGSITNISQRNNFRLLEIGSSGGNTDTTGLLGASNEAIVFTTYVNANATNATLGGAQANTSDNNTYGYAKSDRIIIHNVATGGAGSAVTAKTAGSVYLQFAIDADTDLGSIKYNDTLNNNGKGGTAVEGNVAVLTVKNNGGDKAENALIKLETKDTLQGFDVLSGTVTGVATDANGMTNGTSDVATGDYTTYFITSLSTTGANTAIQDTVASTFATSLDIFAANFNSLNKRMGELRDNDNSQGAWGRIFGGQQTSDFGLGSKTTYVTAQVGYDYAFGFEGANNYLGLALAYSNASSKTSNATNTLNGVSEGLDGDMKSNMIEVGIYNAYVQDEGWFNDSIFKFSYIMNDFSTTGTASGNSISTTNYGIILSDEFGYRFKLGGNKEWYIDPQAEFSFGYVNGTEYTLTSGRSELQAKSDALMQLRARFGSSFGYDFKAFTQGKGVDAKLYVGTFYEYDYMNGGDVTLTTNLGGVNSIQSSLSSDGRVVVNVGSNVTIKENTRIYFDFETSFAGKIRTDYQVNAGVRYSFGENAGYTPLDANKKSNTPLKVSDEKKEEAKEAVEPSSNSAENTTESKAQ